MTKLTYAEPEEAGMDPGRIGLIRERLATWMDGKTERGGVFLVARRGKIVLHEALGPQTDKTGSPPMEKDSIFQISSITKPTTATGIMMLVEDGLVGLNRPIKEYFPELCGEGVDDVEVQHLLTHTSGFREAECWEHYAKNLDGASAEPEPGRHPVGTVYGEVMKGVKSHYAPGSLMHYCNHNYALLSDLPRRVTGKSAVEFFKDRIFDPLGMEGSCYIRDKAKTDRHVIRGHNVPAGSIPDNPLAGNEGTYLEEVPSGYAGMNSTALDLAILGQTLLNGGTYGDTPLLSPASVREMTRDQLPGIKAEINELRGPEASWGLGWAVQGNHRWPWYSSTLAPQGTFWHTGAGGSQIWIDPVNEIVGVYLSVYLILDETVGFLWHGDMFMNMVTAAAVD